MDVAVRIGAWGQKDSIYGNIFDADEDCTPTGVAITIGDKRQDDGGHVVFNNTFYDGSSSYTWIDVNWGSAHTNGNQTYQDYQIKYNLFFRTQSTRHVRFQDGFGEGFFTIDSNSWRDDEAIGTRYYCNSVWRDTSGWNSNCGFGDNSYFSDIGVIFGDTANSDFTIDSPPSEISMDRTYAGQTWTQWGAPQPAGAPEPGTRSTKLRGVK